MASIRRVRRDFRKEVLRLISSGDGNNQKLLEAAGKHFGNLVGYEVLIRAFLNTEVGNAVSFLRSAGHIETIGKQWKLTEELQPEDAEVISARRLKRLRGELKEQTRFAHHFGRTEEAIAASAMLAIVSRQLESDDVRTEMETQERTPSSREAVGVIGT